MKKLERFNDWLASRVTKAVGTMWCAYLFAALALVSLPGVTATHNIVNFITWVTQTFLQLVLLSVLMVGERLASEEAQKTRDELRTMRSEIRKLKK